MLKLLAKPVAESIQSQVLQRSRAFFQKHQRRPKLAVVLVGENPASVIYTRKKGETAIALEMEHETLSFPKTAKPNEVRQAVDRLNKDPSVDGILIQRPLPSDFLEREVLYWVSPEKDVDAFHPENTGKLFLGLPCFQPCTPAGIMALLNYYGIDPRGKTACVVGRSSIVGKPMAALLLNAHSTVIHCHSRTPDLKAMTRQAEILVIAAGKPGLIDRSFIREGAVVIDVGIHRVEAQSGTKRIVGDVVFDDVAKVASAMTPVPGGVGPMTISILMENTILAAETREGRRQNA